MFPEHVLGDSFWAYQNGKRTRGALKTCWRDYVSWPVWEWLSVAPEEVEEVASDIQMDDSTDLDLSEWLDELLVRILS